ncbi:hypothetical protein QBC46DRAFT_394939 [Diplogelasinospora grovesii]|uniref:Uncharacterized protein n=1 Tax=Diplogelasinospora grovesii TaxID=303347 RepID=A0AAN6MZN6_9PEZI|nr:hypothetical protein QBC46DRAFT_394939 [Diplogelasinospora grovesii]
MRHVSIGCRFVLINVVIVGSCFPSWRGVMRREFTVVGSLGEWPQGQARPISQKFDVTRCVISFPVVFVRHGSANSSQQGIPIGAFHLEERATTMYHVSVHCRIF